MDLKARAKQLKTDLPAVFLALKRKDTPWTAKALAALTIGYALSPIDLIPDFIPVLGYLDDLILLPALVALTIRLIPAEVLASCRAEAEGLWKDGKPKRWYYAIPIVLFWLAILFLVVRAILSKQA
ncbi:MAG: YkvA family protein [Christensenella sp.]|nr:YkvA family protein [Christensenella sp.]